MKYIERILTMAGLFLLGLILPASAAEYFVNAESGNDAWDGKAATHEEGTTVGPKKTVQAAVNLADGTERTVVTLAPGVYAEGGTVGTARVVVSKNNVTVRSATGKPEDVAIVGALGAGDNRTGTGATRCFGISAVSGVIVQGITFRDGANKDNGGGLIGKMANPEDLTLIDCVVSNCVANMGGGAHGVTAHATRFTANKSVTAPAGAAVLYGRLANCLVDNNDGYPLNYSYAVVNCTIVNNKGKVGSDAPGTGAGIFANNLAFGNLNGGKEENGDASMNCSRSVLEGTPTFKTIDTDSVKGSKVVLGQVVAPIFGDYRPVADGVCDGLGDASYLTNVPMPDGYTYHDLAGNTVETTGAIAVGAYQATAEQKAALVKFNDSKADTGDMEIAGAVRTVKAGVLEWIVPTDWPVTYQVKPLHADTFAVIQRKPGALSGTDYKFTAADGTLALTPAPDAQAVLELATQTGTHFYVSPDGVDEDNNGRDPAKPLKTLQKAVVAAGSSVAIIHAADGEYAEGGDQEASLLSRVVIKGNTLLTADNPGKAVIVGAPDPDTHGLGPKATRCCAMNGSLVCLRGFVLMDGYTAASSGTAGQGGGVYANGGTATIMDCTITNNTGYRGAGVYGGTVLRSKIVGNHSESVYGVVSNAKLVSSLVAANDSTVGAGVFVTVDSTLYDSTVDCNGARMPVIEKVVNAAYGSLIANYTGAKTTFSAEVGTLFGNDFLFADSTAKDYRLGVLSPAINAVKATDLAQFPDYWTYPISDLDGNLPVYAADGSRTAGAYWADFRPVVVACGTADGHGATTNVVAAVGQEVTVTATDGATRPFLGFVVNGVTNLTTETSYTFAPSAEPGVVTTVAALYGNEWFVDASRPAGSGNGWTWGTAFRTLAEAAAKAVSGDTIRVAAGTYNEGEMLYNKARFSGSTPTIKSRVWVKEGVTLVSAAGAASTIICGASATTDADADGNGPNALRCVCLDANAKIVGFTLTGGRTAKEGSSTTDDACGGAVIGGEYLSSEVVDCIIDDNRAFAAGGALEYCRCVRSKVINCYANTACVGHNASFNSCVIDHCHNVRSGNGDAAVVQYHEFDSCTVGTDITRLTDGLKIYVFGTPRGDIVNSLVLNERLFAATASAKVIAKSCVLVGKIDSGTDTYEFTDCLRPGLAEVELDANYRPVVGSCVGIDVANDEVSSAEALQSTDLTGFPRVLNGQRDIGALEADWRPCYGRDLGGRAVVTEVSSAVVEANGKVTIPGGASITFTMNNTKGENLKYEFSAVVSDGTLTLTLDGEMVTITDLSAIDFTLTPGEHTLVLALAGEATETAVINRMASRIGLAIFVR